MRIEDINRDAFLFIQSKYKLVPNDDRFPISCCVTYFMEFPYDDLDIDEVQIKVESRVHTVREKVAQDMPRIFCIAIANYNGRNMCYFSFIVGKSGTIYSGFSEEFDFLSRNIERLMREREIGYLDAEKKAKDAILVNVHLAMDGLIEKLENRDTRIATINTPSNFKNPRSFICPFTILTNKKITYKYDKMFGNKLEWKHSWRVSGHWRKTSGLGKDRNGEYILGGRTWVSPCIKGAGPLVEKLKIVK